MNEDKELQMVTHTQGANSTCESVSLSAVREEDEGNGEHKENNNGNK